MFFQVTDLLDVMWCTYCFWALARADGMTVAGGQTFVVKRKEIKNSIFCVIAGWDAAPTCLMGPRKGKKYQRRMFNGRRRGRRNQGKLEEQRQRRSRGTENEENQATHRLRVLQFNAGSVVKNLNLFRSLIYDGNPDIVIVQEDWIVEKTVPYHIDGYAWFHAPRSVPRSTTGIIRGGGVSILIRTANPFLIPQLLPATWLGDTSTEILRMRLFWWNPGGLTTLEINNIYKPPIASTSDDTRSDCFDASLLSSLVLPPNSFCCETSDFNNGLLICGDFNSHHPLWDKIHRADKTGRALAKFFDDNNFNIANDGSPTYYTQQSRSAIDLTAYRGQIAIENWTAEHPPLGLCHHQVLSYEIASLQAEPLHLHSTDGLESNEFIGISWKNVDWCKFNNIVAEIEEALLKTYPKQQTSAKAKVHWRAKALYHAFNIASRELPKGKIMDPVPWCTPELLQLMEERNKAWTECKGTCRSLKWGIWKDKAAKLNKKCQEASSESWHEFCSSLDKNTDSDIIANVIRSMSGKSRNNKEGFPIATVLEDHIFEKVVKEDGTETMNERVKHVSTNKGKAEVFRKSYAKIFKRKRPQSLIEKQQRNKMKQRVHDYINSTNSKNNCDASPFTMKELKAAIRDTKKKKHKSPGYDGLSNEFFVHASKPVQKSILTLSNLIWATGAMPSPFVISVIAPIYKADKPPELPSSYRPIALTSCFSKLIERMVIRRLMYRVELNHVISRIQSGFRPGRSTDDTLMRLVSDVQQGFECRPALRTVLAQLDLAKAYDRVDYLQLLDTFRQLCLPPVYARFYKGFLNDR